MLPNVLWRSHRRSREQPARQHAVGGDAHPQLAGSGQDRGLRSPAHERIFDLQGNDRSGFARPANRGRGRFGNSDVAHVARLDETRQRSIGVLNRGTRIDARRLIEVDVIRSQAAQAVGEEIFYGFGAQIVTVERAVRAAHGAEFDGEKHIFAPAFDGPPDEHFVVAHAVEVAGIEHGDSRSRARRESWRCFPIHPRGRTCRTWPCIPGRIAKQMVRCVPGVLVSLLPNPPMEPKNRASTLYAIAIWNEKTAGSGACFSLRVFVLATTKNRKLKHAPLTPAPRLRLCPLPVCHLCYIFCRLWKSPRAITREDKR